MILSSVFPLFAVFCVVSTVAFDAGPIATFDAFWTLRSNELPECGNATLEQLLQTGRMTAALDQRRVAVPFSVLAQTFAQPNLWPLWNFLFSKVITTLDQFAPCKPLRASFHILPDINFGNAQLLSPMIVRAKITNETLHYSWTYRFANPDGSFALFGRHDYFLAPARDDTNSTFLLSWEKAAGDLVDANMRVEEHTLQKATLAAMEGVQCLEQVYEQTGALRENDIQIICGQKDARKKWEEMLDGGYFLP